MSINPCNRATSYFQIMRDRNMMLSAEDLDFQFNSLIDYLNNEMLSFINNLVIQKAPGVVGSANYYLKNIGDGNTEWSPINLNIFGDYSISFDKFAQFTNKPNAIIASIEDKSFQYIDSGTPFDILFATKNKRPIWRKLQSFDILDNSIPVTKIVLNSIESRHLAFSLQTPENTLNPWITNSFIENETIFGQKLQDNSIKPQNIDPAIIQLRKINIDKGKVIYLDNSLEDRHFKWDSNLSDIRKHYFLWGSPFTSDNIEDGSITEEHLDTFNDQNTIPIENYFMDGSLDVRHIKDNSVNLYYAANVPGVYYTYPRLTKECLDPAIRQKLGI